MNEIQQYVDKKKKLYDNILLFFENMEDSDDQFKGLIKIINKELKNHEDFEHFLHLLFNISNYHCRTEKLINKITIILKYYQNQIKKNFSNLDIYTIFADNKLILLFLLENKIIEIDDNIFQSLINKEEYRYFFFTEIKSFIDGNEQIVDKINEELISIDSDIFFDYEKKRHEGENDSYICSLIRSDLVEDFISFINRNPTSFSNAINTSIFETNSFLIKNTPTIIEYTVFFGAIQIFQYLIMNNAELTPSLWLYAIHSNNPELIHLLESYNVERPDDSYEICFAESIKCHHNAIANYIHDNFLITEKTLHKAAKENKIELIYYLLSTKKDICKKCFNKIDTLTEIAIPPSVISIGVNAFSDCSSLRIIAIPSSVKSIGSNAFSGCSSLEEIIIPNSVTSIGSSAFCECEHLYHIKIPFFVKSIESCLFNECYSLKDISISPSVTSIGEYAFYKCFSLEKVTIPLSVTSIGKYAFYECKSLIRISIPEHVPAIEEYTFYGCESLKQVGIPSSLLSIGGFAFDECKLLEQIKVPNQIMICDNAFPSKTILIKES